MNIIDGQKIEKRLSSGIAKEVSRIKAILKNYRSMCTGEDLDYRSVIDLSSTFWTEEANQKSENPDVPIAIKQQIIHNVLMMRRSSEEKLLLKEDMLNTMKFMKQKVDTMEQASKRMDIDQISPWQVDILFLKKKYLDGN